MAFHTYLDRLRSWAKSSPRAARPRKAKSRLGLENLEDRLALSTLSISGSAPNRVLTYDAGNAVANNLTISRSGSTYTFSETGEPIQLGSSLNSTVTVDRSLFDRIQVNLKDGSDTLSVQSTDAPVSADMGLGSDVVNVGNSIGLDGILATVTVNGGAADPGSTDVLHVSDQGAGTFPALSRLVDSITATAVTRTRLTVLGAQVSKATVNFSNMESLGFTASDQAETISVGSTPLGATVEVAAAGGDDAITVGNSLDLIRGKLTVRGDAGSDVLTINDTAAATGRKYAVTTNSVKQGTTEVDLSGLEGLAIKAPNQVNAVDVQSAVASMPLTYIGGTLQDTVTLSDGAIAGNKIYTLAAGQVTRFDDPFFFPTIDASIKYSGVDRLAINAGRGNDTFKMTDSAQPLLTLNGGLGIDTIDYSAFTSSVVVNMILGNATKVSALSGVENATGGAAGDTLVGDAKDNLLKGLGGRDVIIGGKGADTLLGGADEDLMIAGDTNFDANAAALQTLHNVWNGAGTTQDRVNKLKVGVTGVKLDDTTVHVLAGVNDDAAHDLLSSDDGGPVGSPNTADWFWANPGALATQDDLTLLTGDFFK
jgi:Ca2+-binding RTX toxin-like protein